MMSPLNIFERAVQDPCSQACDHEDEIGNDFHNDPYAPNNDVVVEDNEHECECEKPEYTTLTDENNYSLYYDAMNTIHNKNLNRSNIETKNNSASSSYTDITTNNNNDNKSHEQENKHYFYTDIFNYDICPNDDNEIKNNSEDELDNNDALGDVQDFDIEALRKISTIPFHSQQKPYGSRHASFASMRNNLERPPTQRKRANSSVFIHQLARSPSYPHFSSNDSNTHSNRDNENSRTNSTFIAHPQLHSMHKLKRSYTTNDYSLGFPSSPNTSPKHVRGSFNNSSVVQPQQTSPLRSRHNSSLSIPTHIYGLEKYVSSELDALSSVDDKADKRERKSKNSNIISPIYQGDGLNTLSTLGSPSPVMTGNNHSNSNHNNNTIVYNDGDADSITSTSSSASSASSSSRSAYSIMDNNNNSKSNGKVSPRISGSNSASSKAQKLFKKRNALRKSLIKISLAQSFA